MCLLAGLVLSEGSQPGKNTQGNDYRRLNNQTLMVIKIQWLSLHKAEAVGGGGRPSVDSEVEGQVRLYSMWCKGDWKYYNMQGGNVGKLLLWSFP